MAYIRIGSVLQARTKNGPRNGGPL